MRKETKTKIYVMADNANKILLITKDVADKLKTDLSSPEVTTYFAFKNVCTQTFNKCSICFSSFQKICDFLE